MHIPVLLDKVIDFLNIRDGFLYIDATLGCGGYAKGLLEKNDKIKIIGIDIDLQALEYTKKVLANYIQQNRLLIFHDNYANIKNIIKEVGKEKIGGVVFDFGMSTLQLKSNRGFSFNDTTLDMRMNTKQLTDKAVDIVNNYSEKSLSDIIYQYGEERYSRLIASKIVNYRKKNKIQTAQQLTEIINNTIPKNYRKSKINPSTRTFQALRIFINNELENIKLGVNNALDILDDSGRCVCVSYHSLEDRIVKQIFKDRKDCKLLTKKPIIPEAAEVCMNNSARSAKLRCVEKYLTH